MDERLPERLKFLVTNSKELSEYLGISVQAVNQFVNGTSFPKHNNLIKISAYYGVSVDYLLGLTDNPKPHLSISEYIGLTEKAIQAVKNMSKESVDGLNKFLESLAD